MKYCGNCGSRMEDDQKYCGDCGEKSIADFSDNANIRGEGSTNHSSSDNGEEYNRNGKLNWMKILAWIFLFPFMLIYTLIKTDKINKPMKIGIILAFFALLIILPKEEQPTTAGVETEQNSEEAEVQEGEETEVQDDSTLEITESEVSENELQETQEKTQIIEGIENDDAARNIKEASDHINMNIQQVKNIEHENTWAGGERYSLSYEGNRVLIYMNGDHTVNSINVGDIKIYEQGYEPLDINDYLTTSEMNAKAATMAEDLVKRTLNYPETAKFPWLDWAYARANDIYAVQSSVEAKNAFGVESKMPFYIEFKMDTESTKPVYVVLDGEVVAGNESQLKAPEKVAIESELAEDGVDEGFVIEYGTLGEYGKEETINGNKEIYYHLPAGEYRVSTTMNSAAVIVMKKEPYKNSDGYMEHETVSMNRFDAVTSSREITLGENDKIMLTIHSTFRFTPME